MNVSQENIEEETPEYSGSSDNECATILVDGVEIIDKDMINMLIVEQKAGIY
jgi:hypothetical protein